jgi:enoyl-CoA hydratase/carnithine racemase
MPGSIETSISGGICRIVISDPERLNAMTPALADKLRAQLEQAEKEARVAILTGAGQAFSAGANLGDVMGDPAALADGGMVLERHYNPLVRAIRDLKIPLITAVRGAAAGVGASLALLGDIIVASETAFFIQSFRRVGLVPDGGAPFTLVRSVGRVRAMEMMLLAEKVTAAQALAWGLVTRVVPDERFDEAVAALAAELASSAPFSVAQIRKMTWSALTSGLDEALDLEVVTQRRAVATGDFREGVQAFIEKRPAIFGGN